MNRENMGRFALPQTPAQILAQNPSYKTIKDSGSDSVSGLVDSEIVVSNQVDLNRARETAVAGELSWDDVELENTEIVVFDELSQIIHDDHLFRKVIWEWKMLPATLYGHLSRLDHDRVREEIKVVSRKTGLRSRGAYLKARLENMK